MQIGKNSYNFSHITCVTKETLQRVLYLLEMPIPGEKPLKKGDYAVRRKEEEDVGQLVQITKAQSSEEAPYEVKTVSKYTNSPIESAYADQLETIPDAQTRILEALRVDPWNGFLLCFEAEQFELMECANDPDRSSSRERSRSRDSDQHPATRPEFFEKRTKHRESPDSGTAADERRHQKALGTPNFCATPPCKVFSTPQPTVAATSKQPTVPTTPPRTGIATEKVAKSPEKKQVRSSPPRVSNTDL
jgi:hypothetical protein